MPRHVFEVNVPNPTARPVRCELRLKRATLKDLAGVMPGCKETLDIVAAGLSADPCAKEGKGRMTLTLDAHESRDVTVIIETNASPGPALAGVHLVDRRDGRDVGGVLLVVTDPAVMVGSGLLVPARRPCPAVLSRDVHAIPQGDDPGDPKAAVPIRVGQPLELVAAVTNPTNTDLEEVTVYLEHLGASGVDFGPGTWNVGRLAAGATFFATWQIMAGPGPARRHPASIVVASKGTEPTRLTGRVIVAGRDD